MNTAITIALIICGTILLLGGAAICIWAGIAKKASKAAGKLFGGTFNRIGSVFSDKD